MPLSTRSASTKTRFDQRKDGHGSRPHNTSVICRLFDEGQLAKLAMVNYAVSGKMTRVIVPVFYSRATAVSSLYHNILDGNVNAVRYWYIYTNGHYIYIHSDILWMITCDSCTFASAPDSYEGTRVGTPPDGRRSKGRGSAAQGKTPGSSDIESVAPGGETIAKEGKHCYFPRLFIMVKAGEAAKITLFFFPSTAIKPQ